MRKLLVLSVLLFAVILILGCSDNQEQPDTEPYTKPYGEIELLSMVEEQTKSTIELVARNTGSGKFTPKLYCVFYDTNKTITARTEMYLINNNEVVYSTIKTLEPNDYIYGEALCVYPKGDDGLVIGLKDDNYYYIGLELWADDEFVNDTLLYHFHARTKLLSK